MTKLYSNNGERFLVNTGEILILDNSRQLVFTGDNGETFFVSIYGNIYTVGDVGGDFLWDIGEISQYSFDYVGETILREYEPGQYFSVTWKGLVSSVDPSGIGTHQFDIRIIGYLALNYELRELKILDYYGAVSGDTGLVSDRWYIDNNKKHSFVVYSDFDAIVDK